MTTPAQRTVIETLTSLKEYTVRTTIVLLAFQQVLQKA